MSDEHAENSQSRSRFPPCVPWAHKSVACSLALPLPSSSKPDRVQGLPPSHSGKSFHHTGGSALPGSPGESPSSPATSPAVAPGSSSPGLSPEVSFLPWPSSLVMSIQYQHTSHLWPSQSSFRHFSSRSTTSRRWGAENRDARERESVQGSGVARSVQRCGMHCKLWSGSSTTRVGSVRLGR